MSSATTNSSLLPLRLPWLWLSLGFGLVLLVIAGSLLSLRVHTVDISLFDKWVHAGAYLTLMLWFSGLYRRQWHLVIGLLLFALGLALDLLQGLLPTRMFDLYDVAANGAGIVVGLVWARFVFEGWCWRFEQLIFSR